MLKVLDNEGELLITLLDVIDAEDLQQRLDKEKAELMEMFVDVPFWAWPVEESPFKEKEFCGEYCKTTTYEEWMKECREWAQKVLDELEEVDM